MGLGFSFSAQAAQPVSSPELFASQNELASPQKAPSIAKDYGFLVRSALLAVQFGGSSFFREININRFFTSRTVVVSSSSRDDDTVDKKRERNIIRKLKVENTEAANHYFR